MKTDSNIKRVNQKRVKVLGVGIDDVTMDEGLEIVEKWLEDSGAAQNDRRRHPGGQSPIGSSTKIDSIASLQNDAKLIFTPGPEFLVTAQSDPEFKKILNSADLNLPDGYGLKIFGNITNIVPGVDFMLALCKLAAKKGYTIGLLGGQTRVTTLLSEKLKEMFPGIKITFAIDGKDADRVVAGYDALRYVDMLFVALGHPKQEKFLWKLSSSWREQKRPIGSSTKIDSIASLQNDELPFRVGMGVGGSFDFISGKVLHPGAIYNSMGLKWLGRFLTRPGYMLPKIIKAVVIFPLLILKDRFLVTRN